MFFSLFLGDSFKYVYPPKREINQLCLAILVTAFYEVQVALLIITLHQEAAYTRVYKTLYNIIKYTQEPFSFSTPTASVADPIGDLSLSSSNSNKLLPNMSIMRERGSFKLINNDTLDGCSSTQNLAENQLTKSCGSLSITIILCHKKTRLFIHRSIKRQANGSLTSKARLLYKTFS